MRYDEGNHRNIREEHRAKRKREIIIHVGILAAAAALLILVIILVVRAVFPSRPASTGNAQTEIFQEKYIAERPELDVQLLEVNPYSRPGTPLEKVNGIVIHYTANPGTTAKNNRDYFNGLAISQETSASSHFVIGLEGEIVQCIPCNEIAYASNDRNADTIAIECCIPDETGKFNGETYDSLVYLTAWLMGRYDLTTDDVIRHYDVTGKDCPKWFVEHENAWTKFKEDLVDYVDTNGVDKSSRTDTEQ